MTQIEFGDAVRRAEMQLKFLHEQARQKALSGDKAGAGELRAQIKTELGGIEGMYAELTGLIEQGQDWAVTLADHVNSLLAFKNPTILHT